MKTILRTALPYLAILALVSKALAIVSQVLHDLDWAPEYVIVATEKDVTQNCQTRPSVVFNGTSPGPPIFLMEGQTTWVRAYNHMADKNLTIHWHGLTMRTAPFSDGTPMVAQWPIAPGEYFDYELHPVAGDAGTYWYHSHIGFMASTAHGAVVVMDADAPPYQYDDEIPMMIGDWYTSTDSEIEADLTATPFKFPAAPAALVFNGQTGTHADADAPDDSCKTAVVSVRPDTTYRLRFLTVCAMSYVITQIDGHSNLTVIEADGRYTKPAATDRIQLGSGERYSALLTTKTQDELDADGAGGRYLIHYRTPDGSKGYLEGSAVLQYDMSGGGDATTTQWKRQWRIPGGIFGEGQGSQEESSSSGDSDSGGGHTKGHSAPSHGQLPGKPDVTVDDGYTEWLAYSLEALNPPAAFPTLDEVTRTLYINVTVDNQNGGALSFRFNDLSWTDAAYSKRPGAEPYLINAYKNGIVPSYDDAQTNFGWDPKTEGFPARVGEVLDIVWQQTNVDAHRSYDYHPMHAHGEHYWDLGAGSGEYDPEANEARFAAYTPMIRDTTMLYSYNGNGQAGETTSAWRAWRLRVTEQNVGAWMMHCHILHHMIMGMATVWVFGDPTAILQQVPYPYVAGYLDYGGSASGNDSYDPLVTSFF